MTNPTSNFGWQMPTASDLVTDLPADFEVFGQAVDTSLADLKGGTTGQVLAKASNTNMDFTWVAQDDSNAIQNAIVDAKGDLIAASAADTPARLAVGTNGQVLTADSTAATGLKWATAASGMTFIARTSFSNVATQAFDSVFTSTYKSYLVIFETLYAATSSDKLQLQFRYAGSTQATNYYGNLIWASSSSATVSNDFSNNVSELIISQSCGSSTNPGSGFMYVTNAGTGTQKANASGSYTANQNGNGGQFTCNATTGRAYDGFLLKSASTNITGTVTIYGLAAA
jgi:hypothetical protein